MSPNGSPHQNHTNPPSFLSVGDPITIIKLNPQREPTWHYTGHITRLGQTCVTLEAFFDKEDTEFFGMKLTNGDRFLETYYTNRWYNIFEVHAGRDNHLRGWYCNIASPAEFNGHSLSYIDLALDLLVFPDGEQKILDMDEFEALEISRDLRDRALSALEELAALFKNTQPGCPHPGW